MNVLIELNVIRNNVANFKKSLFLKKKIIFDIFPDTPTHKVRPLPLAYNIQIPIWLQNYGIIFLSKTQLTWVSNSYHLKFLKLGGEG